MNETEIEELKIKVKKAREVYNQWPDGIKRDCQILRALKSGEMHNWFVCCNVFHMSSEKLGEYWDKVKQNKEYIDNLTKHNKEYIEFTKEEKTLSHAVTESQIANGRKFSKLQLVLFGFNIEYAEAHGT